VKIEIGESLVYSWLKHVKKCQIVQNNWKPSPRWEKKEIGFQKLKDNIQNEFKNSGYDIFKNTASMNQFFQQAEIDAVGFSQGVDITDQKYYFVDVAFHENGLNYGTSNETISRILKKFIRSYFISLAYFRGSLEGIYFITPKMSIDTILTPLNEQLKKLTDILKDSGFSPNFQLLVNQDFNNEVLTPTMGISGEVADTNELFLRSVQLWKMFTNNVQPEVTKKTKAEGISKDLDKVSIGIGQYVQNKLGHLIEADRITNSEVSNLLDPTYSKKVFNLQFPFLRNIQDGKNDNKGHARYYADSWMIKGKEYYLCNHWYKEQRTQFDTWMIGLPNN
jgi:hypothetical protein